MRAKLVLGKAVYRAEPLLDFSQWRHSDAADYALRMAEVFGLPTAMGHDAHPPVPDLMGALWENIEGFATVMVKDESIPHMTPMPHRDFVYSAINLPVPTYLLSRIAEVTGSVIIDGLKVMVKARCGALIKNAVTLGWVQDCIGNPMLATPYEYSRRITSNDTPDWFPDTMGERNQ